MLLEFALVAPLLLLLLYGIVSLGIVLAVKESVTQAASDGARAAVTYPQDQNGDAGPSGVAVSQANNAIHWFGSCGSGGVRCTTSVVPCPNAPDQSTFTGNCLTLTVSYDYQDNPIIPLLPGLGLVLPRTVTGSTTTLLAGREPWVVG